MCGLLRDVSQGSRMQRFMAFILCRKIIIMKGLVAQYLRKGMGEKELEFGSLTHRISIGWKFFILHEILKKNIFAQI